MKRPSEYMTMTDGVTQNDYKNALNKYIDYLEAKIKALSQHDVSNQRELLLAYSEFCYKEEWSMVDDQIIPQIDEFLSQ